MTDHRLLRLGGKLTVRQDGPTPGYRPVSATGSGDHGALTIVFTTGEGLAVTAIQTVWSRQWGPCDYRPSQDTFLLEQALEGIMKDAGFQR